MRHNSQVRHEVFRSRRGRASGIDQCLDGRGLSADYRDPFDYRSGDVDRALNDEAHD